MKIYAILLAAILSTCAPAHADAPDLSPLEKPPALPEGLSTGVTMHCSDNETGKRGFCTAYAGENGTGWMVFTYFGQVEFIRYTEPGQPYITVWQRQNTY